MKQKIPPRVSRKRQATHAFEALLKKAAYTPMADEFVLSAEDQTAYRSCSSISFDDAFNQVMSVYNYHHYLFLSFSSQSSQFSNCPEPNLYAMLRLMSELGFSFRSGDLQLDHAYQGDMTPLVFAASHREQRACTYLVAQSASVDQLVMEISGHVRAPIIEALKSGCQELCRFFLLQGASLKDELGHFYPDYQTLVGRLPVEEAVLFNRVLLIDDQIKEARKSYKTFIALVDAQINQLSDLGAEEVLVSEAFLTLSRALNNDGIFNNDEIFPGAPSVMDQNHWKERVQSLKDWLQGPFVQKLYWWDPSHSTLQTLVEQAAKGLLTRADLQAFQQAGRNLNASLAQGGPILCYIVERSRLPQAPLARMLGLFISAGVSINDYNRAEKTPSMIVQEAVRGREYLKRFFKKLAPREPLILSAKLGDKRSRSMEDELNQPSRKVACNNK
ncbi:MAG: hypothetical protein KA508_02120 [Gammaproteobacteria bacterium]|nr:hypothetical protein [Gammaproteobacteria bacterium]